MRLASDSHKLIEAFHRDRLQNEALKLPPVYLYSGRAARFVTHAFRIGAITFGRHILVKPTLVARDGNGRLTVPAWLVAHETTHVLQYTEAGFVGFLVLYLRDYWRGLRELGKWNGAARMAAYFAISVECDARAAELAYAAWIVNKEMKGEK